MAGSTKQKEGSLKLAHFCIYVFLRPTWRRLGRLVAGTLEFKNVELRELNLASKPKTIKFVRASLFYVTFLYSLVELVTLVLSLDLPDDDGQHTWCCQEFGVFCRLWKKIFLHFTRT